MKKLLIAIMVMSLAIVGVAYAAIQGANSAMVGDSDQITESTAQVEDAEGGNVTTMNLTATVSTDRWQGYYGNVSGSLALGMGASTFYSFSAATALTVFASQNQTFDFTSLGAALAADIDTQWGYGTGNDQAADVFAGSERIGTTVDTAYCTLASSRLSGIFDDGTPTDKLNFAFGANISTGACFDGSTCDYEVMVPADAATGETYYFFVEI